MKDFLLKKILLPLLAGIAKRVVAKNKPIIVGVTGSIGKSSTKEAIYTVLKSKFRVRRSLGNLNNEIGLPLSIISDIEPKKKPLKWLKICWQALRGCFLADKNYPEILVLEMAVDRPKDMDYLISIASPRIAVLTGIGISHLEFFKKPKNILKEKIKIAKNLDKNGLLIVNHDDPLLRPLKKNFSKPIVSYGFRKGADVLAKDLKIGYNEELGEGVSLAKGSTFQINYQTVFMPVKLPYIISKAQIYSALAGIVVGLHLGMNLVETTEALRGFKSLPGRMRLIKGKNGNLIIDDTYNAAPASVRSALEVIALIKSRKKVIILGDMLELGDISQYEHGSLAGNLASVADKVILVGQRTLETHKKLIALGFPKDRIVHFKISTDAVAKVESLVGKGAVVLIKGSQGLRMEKISEVLVSDKSLKELPRQDKSWKKKPVKEV